MKALLFLSLNLLAASSFGDVGSRFGITADFLPEGKPADVKAVHGTCQMNDHIRKISFEFTNFQSTPGNFDFLKYDFKATYQLKKGGTYEFKPTQDAEPVLAMGWQDIGNNKKSKSISAFFGKSGPDTEALFLNAYDWTSPFEFSSTGNTITIKTKYTWIKFYDPKGTDYNYEPLTGGDCTWVLDLK